VPGVSGIVRIKGLVALVRDAVDGGSRAVQRVQIATAKRTFDILEAIPGVAEPARAVRVVYDVSVNSTHTMIRLVNGAVGGIAGVALDAYFDRRSNSQQDGELAKEESARNNTDSDPPAGSPSE